MRGRKASGGDERSERVDDIGQVEGDWRRYNLGG